MQRCLEQVAAYRASGLKAKQWAAANGVGLRQLASWSAHARRWQARLDGVSCQALAPQARQAPGGFVAASVPALGTSSVRIELKGATHRLELHWPLGATRELAAWCREVSA
jgi:hypothetical protein